MLGIILISLKFLALFSTGIWGVISLLTDYRDKEGKITPWGRRALIGVILSTFVAIVTQVIETYNDQRSSKESADRNYKLLTEINRAVYPLSPAKDLFVSASATIPLTDTFVAGYAARLKEGAKKVIAAKKDSLENGRIWVIKTVDVEGKETPGDLLLYYGASLLPDYKKEKIAYRALSRFGVEFRIYKTPIDVDSFIIQRRQDQDLHFLAEAKAGSIHGTYTLGGTTMEISSDNLLVNTDRDWQSNSKISSLIDLSGAQMFFYFMDYDTGDDRVDTNHLKLEQHAKINHIELHIANRRFFISNFKSLGNDMYPLYVYTFPSDMINADINLP